MPDQPVPENLVKLGKVVQRAHNRLLSQDEDFKDTEPCEQCQGYPTRPQNITSDQAMEIVKRVSTIVAARFPSIDPQEIIAMVVRNVLSQIPSNHPEESAGKEEMECLSSDGEVCGFRCRCYSDKSDGEVFLVRFLGLILLGIYVVFRAGGILICSFTDYSPRFLMLECLNIFVLVEEMDLYRLKNELA